MSNYPRRARRTATNAGCTPDCVRVGSIEILRNIKADAVGIIPPGWQVKSVQELIADGVLDRIQDGNHGESHPVESDYVSSGVPFLMSGCIRGGQINFQDAKYLSLEHARSLRVGHAKCGDVLLTHKGNQLGRTAILTGIDWAVLTPQITYYRIRQQSVLLPLYLRYLFESPRFQHQFKRGADQSTRPFVSITSQKCLYLLLPPIEHQRAIAEILGSLDDKIELNRRMNETLEGMARAIFKSWFVDFDPVRAKAAGRQPAGMDADTAALFPDGFVDSPLGKIPKGWRVGSLLDHACLLSGGTPKTDEPSYWGGAVPWASAKDVSQCGETFLISTERTITEQGLENSSTQMIAANSTVVVARGATTGRMTMFGMPIAMNQTCYALRSKPGSHFFLYCQARQVIGDLVHSAHGSVFDTITTRTFETTPVLVPDPFAARAFDKAVQGLFFQILAQQQGAACLATIRNNLMPRLLSGAVHPGNVEKRSKD